MGITKIVGQEKLKRLISVFLVSDSLNTMLISGAKGTGKSVCVREIEKTFNIKVNTLPLGATSDMIYGSYSLKDLVKTGDNIYKKGILEKSENEIVYNEIVYIDEINLFSVQILKEILDGIENKKILIENTGVSKEIEINTKLIGTMNPSEGFLSPTVLEKIDLYIEMDTLDDEESRKEIIKRNLNLSLSENTDEENEIAENVNSARKRLRERGNKRRNYKFCN